jgi:chromosome segregation ATPase
MTRGNKVLIVMLVAALGIWGCAKKPGNAQNNGGERLNALETKCAKLEDDYRAVASARDQVRKKVTALEEERANLQKELAIQKAVIQERDNLRAQVNSRTTERDALQQRCDRLKKGLQSLLGQDEAAGTATGVPVTSANASADEPVASR